VNFELKRLSVFVPKVIVTLLVCSLGLEDLAVFVQEDIRVLEIGLVELALKRFEENTSGHCQLMIWFSDVSKLALKCYHKIHILLPEY